jgi:hypothetical protein
MAIIDLYDNNYYDYSTDDFPMLVTWINPEDGESRRRILRSEAESSEFFTWFLQKYPGIEYTLR